MTEQEKMLAIERVQNIPMIATMLEVICRSTGMGFAAVARVTEDRWIACSVRDEISFGLQPGGELKIETTICNEIRHSLKPVIINHVAQNEVFAKHHTPAMYGFQSYISLPIILKNGSMFGTLCAIDPAPADVDNIRTIGMFQLFAELLAFHLDTVDQLSRSNKSVYKLNTELTQARDENRQYQFISNHNLQEPLRKLRVFSNLLLSAADKNDAERTKYLAEKVNMSAQRFSMMIKDLSDFSGLADMKGVFEPVDMKQVISEVCLQLEDQLHFKQASVTVDDFPKLDGITIQLEQLFYHLIHNSLKFAMEGRPPLIQISLEPGEQTDTDKGLLRIRYTDNGRGIEAKHLERVFDIFSKLDPAIDLKSGGIGLSHCRKIIRNHGGTILAESAPAVGTTFRITLPLKAGVIAGETVKR